MSSSSLPKRAAILAACIGATAAVGASPAFAAVPGENIFGSGSSLQKIAQQNVWTPTWHSTAADHSQLSNNPTATYTSSSSGGGLAEWGNTTGALDLTQDPTAHNGATNGYGRAVLDAYVGTDDPPTSANLADATTAATGKATTKVNEITVPVAQAPVAMLLSLPKGITAGAGSKVSLTNALLQEIWNAAVPKSTDYATKTWGALLEDAGFKKVTGTPVAGQFKDAGGATGGGQAITLQVRSTASGTSYNFKGFLQLSGDTLYNTFVNDNDSWPVATVNTDGGIANSGGSQEVSNTTATPGSVGYANLADAAAGTPPYTVTLTSTATGGTHQIAYAQVQANKGGSGTVYAGPAAGTGIANVYTGNNINVNGANPAFVGHWTVPLSGTTLVPTGTWGGTLPSDPDVYDHSLTGGHKTAYYPIVAGTYDLGWTDYDEASSNLVADFGGTAADATAAGNTALSFLTYVVAPTKGQADLTKAAKYYAILPSKIDGYGQTAVKSITP